MIASNCRGIWQMPDNTASDWGRSKMRPVLVVLFIAMSLPKVFLEANAVPITVIDQQNLAPEMGSGGGVIFGQSFIPTLPRVDAFEVVMGDFGAMVAAQILNGVVGFDGLVWLVIGTFDHGVTLAR